MLEGTANVHDAILRIGDPATELVLTKRCADVCKITYAMRVGGDQLQRSTLLKFDELVRITVENCLGGEMSNSSWKQASVSVSDSGLGFRPGAECALGCFIASRVASRHIMVELASRFVQCGMVGAGVIEAAYDARTNAAVSRLSNTLGEVRKGTLNEEISSAVEATAKRWTSLLGPTVEAEPPSHSDRRNGGLVLEAGEEDPDYSGPSSARAVALQRKILKLVDDERLESLDAELQAAEQWSDVRRIKEIRDPRCSHNWLWALHPAHGCHMRPDEYVAAVRLRLGAEVAREPVICARCGIATMDRCGAHALLCSRAQATIGHNRVRDVLLDFIHMADPAAEIEVGGLIPTAMQRRPADILSGAALAGALAAIDVGITSPDASGGGVDCCESMRRRKLADYEPHVEEFRQRGMVYTPMIWSAYGRPHSETEVLLRNIAKRAARRKGIADFENILRRAVARIGCAIWKRAARMVLQCLP